MLGVTLMYSMFFKLYTLKYFCKTFTSYVKQWTVQSCFKDEVVCSYDSYKCASEREHPMVRCGWCEQNNIGTVTSHSLI
jgi:hypothetical protein